MKIRYENKRYPLDISFNVEDNILEVWDGRQDRYVANYFKYHLNSDWSGITSKGEFYLIKDKDEIDRLNKLMFIIENKRYKAETYEVVKNIRDDLKQSKYEFINELISRTTNIFTLIAMLRSAYPWKEFIDCWDNKVEYLDKIFKENIYLDKNELYGLVNN